MRERLERLGEDSASQEVGAGGLGFSWRQPWGRSGKGFKTGQTTTDGVGGPTWYGVLGSGIRVFGKSWAEEELELCRGTQSGGDRSCTGARGQQEASG